MSSQNISQPDGGAGTPSSSPPKPDAAAYPPEVLQRLVDQAASFNVFSSPCADAARAAIRLRGVNGDVIGFRVNEDLHRFSVSVQPPTAADGLKAANAVGEKYGTFSHRWMLAPDDFVASPGLEPPPTLLDPSRSQRFVMLDSVCTFGGGKDGFRGFGAGKTFPSTTDGEPSVLAAAVGTILEGFGAFANHSQGTYVHCGSLSPQQGFTGNLLLRVMDSQGTLRYAGSLPPMRSQPWPEPGITYVVFRGQAVASDPVTQRVGPDGQFRGLNVVQGLRLVSLSSGLRGDGSPRSMTRVGQIIGRITAHVEFNPAAPGGTALNPIPFTTVDDFNFTDGEGHDIGSFTADTSEGRVFNIAVSGQAGIRFGGVGQILNGTGAFQDMRGLMTDNSVVIFTPHVSASLYVLRLHDPEGRFRAAVGGS